MSADRQDEYDGARRSEHCDGVFLGFSYFAPPPWRRRRSPGGRATKAPDARRRCRISVNEEGFRRGFVVGSPSVATKLRRVAHGRADGSGRRFAWWRRYCKRSRCDSASGGSGWGPLEFIINDSAL